MRYFKPLILIVITIAMTGCTHMLRPQTPKERPYHIQQVTFPGGNDSVTLAGELTQPHGSGPFTGIILISGSGPQNRDEELVGHKPFLVLSDHLTRQGYAVLRYDDRGTADSTGDYKNADLKDFAHDAAAAFAWLRTQPDINPDQIGYLGHSEGGYIAPLAATQTHAAFMVFLAGPAKKLLPDVMVTQGRDIMRAQGESEDDIKTMEEQYDVLVNILKTSKTQQEAKERLEPFLTAEGFSTSEQNMFYDIWATRWGLLYAHYDPMPALRRFSNPVLALYGDKDLQVSSVENAPIMESALQNPLSHVQVLENRNHLFQHSETGKVDEYPFIRTTIEPDTLNAISSWLETLQTDQ